MHLPISILDYILFTIKLSFCSFRHFSIPFADDVQQNVSTLTRFRKKTISTQKTAKSVKCVTFYPSRSQDSVSDMVHEARAVHTCFGVLPSFNSNSHGVAVITSDFGTKDWEFETRQEHHWHSAGRVPES